MSRVVQVAPVPARPLWPRAEQRGGRRAAPGGSRGAPTAASPLHVLQVFQPETGGVPRYAASLARGLRSGGWPVSVAGPERALSSAGLDDLGIEVLPIEAPRSPHPLQDVVTLRKLARWCREREVSVIHGHSTKAGLLAALAGRSARIPSVYTPHGWAFERLVRPELRASYALFERELAHRYHAAVVTVSASGRRAAERWRVVPRGRIRVIPTGLPPMPAVGRAAARRLLGLGQDDFAAAWVGRVGSQKRPQDLAPLARGLGGTASVVALCDGLAGTALARELQAAGVALLDPAHEAATLYAAADILVHTSAWEACPLVVLEAMSAGLPIVAYDVGGLTDQVQAGRTGYLVAPGDLEMMCDCVGALARRADLRAAMGEAARERVATLFDFSSMLDAIRQTYSAVAGGRPPAFDQGSTHRLGPSTARPVADVADLMA